MTGRTAAAGPALANSHRGRLRGGASADNGIKGLTSVHLRIKPGHGRLSRYLPARGRRAPLTHTQARRRARPPRVRRRGCGGGRNSRAKFPVHVASLVTPTVPSLPFLITSLAASPEFRQRGALAGDDRSHGSSATSPAAVRVVLHLRRGRTEVQLQRPDHSSCLASMQWRACSSVGRDGRLQARARLPRRRRLRTALEHRSRAKVGELHHQLPQGFVRAATAAATAGTASTPSSPAAHVVRAVPHGTHGA